MIIFFLSVTYNLYNIGKERINQFSSISSILLMRILSILFVARDNYLFISTKNRINYYLFNNNKIKLK